nr:acyltransferase family protein [Enterovibrio coralii]
MGIGCWQLRANHGGTAPIFSRNGPFFSLLMVVAGFELRRRDIRFSDRSAALMLLGGLALYLSEGLFLRRYDTWMATHDFLIGTPILAIGLFSLLLNHPNWGDKPMTFALSKRVLGVYVCHFIPLVALFNVFGAFGIEGPLKDGLIAPLTIVLSFGLVFLLEKIPFTRFLVKMK